MTKIGDISVITKPPTITMMLDRGKQAQQMVQKIPKTINDINLSILNKFEISKGEKVINIRYLSITGCTIMPSGKIVFVDKTNNRLLIHNEDGLFVCEIPLSRAPLDVTCIDENTIAVTHNIAPYHIEIINIVNKKVVNQIETSSQCYGITTERGRLIYYEAGSGIQTVDVNNKSTANTVVKDDYGELWNYVTTSEDKIYRTKNASVACYTVTGQTVWEYKDESILKSVSGVAVDKDSNVYVVSNANKSIVVLSPDGKEARRLLAKENGMQEAYSIYLDKGRNFLLVTSLRGTAILYNIE